MEPNTSTPSSPALPKQRPHFVNAELNQTEQVIETNQETTLEIKNDNEAEHEIKMPSIPSSRPKPSTTMESNQVPHLPSSRPKKSVAKEQNPPLNEEDIKDNEKEIKIEEPNKPINAEINNELEIEEPIEKEIEDKKPSEPIKSVESEGNTEIEEEKEKGKEEEKELDNFGEEKVKLDESKSEPSDKSIVEKANVSELNINKPETVTEGNNDEEILDKGDAVEERRNELDESAIESTIDDKGTTNSENLLSNENTLSSRKGSHSSVKKTLDDLNSIEQEIELTSEKISADTDDKNGNGSINNETEDQNQLKLTKTEISKEKIAEEVKKEIIKQEKEEHITLPVIPKSRPKPKSLEKDEPLSTETKEEIHQHSHLPPKVPTKRPSVSSEHSNNDESPSVNVSHKKPPPRVPKKPSSRIAQFQEMLEQQQKADLGLIETPKPKPKIPLKHYKVTPEGVSEGKDVDFDNENENELNDENSTPVPKVDRVHSKFAQSLNGMIGVGLPGMAFGGNPFAAIKAAKEAQQGENEGNNDTQVENGNDNKVKDIRRDRARGPRGRKLPDAVKKTVEINDTTLGNTLTVVVKDIWSFDFNKPIEEDVTKVETNEIEEIERIDRNETDNEKDEVSIKENNIEPTIDDDSKGIVEKEANRIIEDTSISDKTSELKSTIIGDKLNNDPINNEIDDNEIQMPATTFDIGKEDEETEDEKLVDAQESAATITPLPELTQINGADESFDSSDDE